MKRALIDMKSLRGVFILFVLALSSSIVYSGDIVPYTFQAGETVSANKMNSNFSALENALSYGILVTRRENGSPGRTDTTYTSEVIVAFCSSDEIVIGATCECSHNDFDYNTTNFGWLRYCAAAGNGVIGGCAIGLDAFSNKYGPPVKVQVFCAKKAIDRSLSDQDEEQILSEEAESRLIKLEEEFQQYEQRLRERLSEK